LVQKESMSFIEIIEFLAENPFAIVLIIIGALNISYLIYRGKHLGYRPAKKTSGPYVTCGMRCEYDENNKIKAIRAEQSSLI